MALPNPWYIDAEARHFAQQQRLLAYAAVEGKEGVLAVDQLVVADLDTPGGAIQVMPGGYSILAKHTGGAFEAYVGKFTTAEQVTVNPTDSSGARTDLVVLRVENPYVSGSGVWSQPVDPLNGPYVHVRVIEGVAAGTNSVQQVDPSWSAIPLARIHRPASTGIVSQSHITDLRSLAKLGGERIIIVEPPPPDEPDPPAPPIAQPIFFDIINETSSGDDDTIDDDSDGSSGWLNWPEDATWTVPVPSWATSAEVFMQLLGIRQEHEGTYGELRVQINNGSVPFPSVTYDFTTDGEVNEGWRRDPMFTAASVSIPSSLRGKNIRFRAQATIEDDPGQDGVLRWTRGSAAILQVFFKQAPISG